MKHKHFLPLLMLFVGAILIFSWRTGYLSTFYRIFVPVGEVRADLIRGMNNIPLPRSDVNSFDFYVAGHTYGSPDIDDRKPGVSLLMQLPTLIDSSPSFFISLGDMVHESKVEDFDNLDKLFLNQVPFPVFNTVGNHDVADRELYEERYGKTFFTFKYGYARLIFLDTELERCSLNETQSVMISTSIAHALRDKNTRYIFIFMHKTLFLNNDVLATERSQQASPNEWKCYRSPKFLGLMKTFIIPAASEMPVYLFAGDVGAWGNLTPYYEQHPNLQLTGFMTGLGDTSQDNILHVRINNAGVNVETIFLNTMKSQPIEGFSNAYWEAVATGKIQLSP